MYKRNAQGWSKYLDFMIIDEISLQLALMIAAALYLHEWVYDSALYSGIGILCIVADATIMVLNNSMFNVLHRESSVEAIKTIKHCMMVFAVIIVYLFAAQMSFIYSRVTVTLAFAFYVVIGYGLRMLWKMVRRSLQWASGKKQRMLVVTTGNEAESLLTQLSSDIMADYKIIGVVLTEETDKKEISGYPIVCDFASAADYIVGEWIDSVYVNAPLDNETVTKLMENCSAMAVPTHYHVPDIHQGAVKRFSENIGGTTVLTTSINYITPLQVFIKRCGDIVIALFGSMIALLIMAVVGPIIKKQSPGPILFKQERVGRNGKPFKMYKIRSMVMDADAQKQDLMAENRVKDGMMFKLDFDPRIIGNKILPDGTKKTGIGEFIRRTSLDEFPQFFNVLEGSMSAVGTRPPTMDEYDRYQYHHRARLAIKPGVTGLWQTSGRSEITDFEEVVRLDTAYILNWSLKEDVKILLKTIGVVFKHKGAM